MFPKLLTISLIFATFPVAFSLNECVRAKGRVFCDGEAYQGAKVRLYDIDEVENLGPITKILKLLNPDDLME
ncbi:unnamed protein product [Bursaphelenchus xylophilus]|uniref:(pine wood nematode) hypothetical protein n=1 Tax=Bursaphelenchus xylophilus TaxID=6326 RepID=A0A1I7RJ30_BURXY|nr:unnamed protein product [Bursaphelenchus xylophilus]CAG9119296.1 unnamed protein product [Bursaphelenchus xylophilus]